MQIIEHLYYDEDIKKNLKFQNFKVEKEINVLKSPTLALKTSGSLGWLPFSW